MNDSPITRPRDWSRLPIRILCVVLAIDVIVCGVLCLNQMMRPAPSLPTQLGDDALFATELRALAAKARNGGSQQWLKVAQALMGHGHYDHAVACYRHLVKLDPSNHDGQFGLAFCLERTGHLEASNRQYELLAELADDTGHLQMLGQYSIYDTGKNQLRMEQADAAMQTFQRLTNFLPTDYQRAKLLLRSGQAEAALSIIEPVLREFPQSKEFRFLECRALFELGRVADARRSADLLERSQTAIRTNFAPDYIHSYRILSGFDRIFEEYSKIFDMKDNDAMAAKLEELRPLVEYQQIPQYKAMLLNLAQVNLDRRRPDAVLESVRQLHEFGVVNAHVLWLEGAALALQGQTAKAIPLWQRSVRMSPDATLHERLATWFESQGDKTQSDQHRAESHLLRARDHYRNDQLLSAEREIAKAVELAPRDPDAWFYLGQIRRALKQDELAQDAYVQCISLDPNHSRARVWIE